MLQFRVLCAAPVAPLQEGCGGYREGAEEVYQNAAWITGYYLQQTEKLDKLGLFSLVDQRLRGDPLHVYTIVGGRDRVGSQNIFPQGGKVERYKRIKTSIRPITFCSLNIEVV